MFDGSKIKEYREDNRFEAIKAEGGLPHSLWETYSAFANSYGGLIVLGVTQNLDGSVFVDKGITNPVGMIKNFWDTVNNRSKVSVNILRDKNVYTDAVGGKTVIVIEVPRAQRQDRPIYINNDLKGGVFRRNFEGDYHCTEAEIRNMIRDAGDITQDNRIIENLSPDTLNQETVKRYRLRFKNLKPEHIWTRMDDIEFLQQIGALKRSYEDGKLHPTLAGLLTFGNDIDITAECPAYFLDYREPFDDAGMRWTDRVTSSDGDWSGNLFDFYFRIQDRMTADIKVPFVLRNGQDQIDDTPMHKATREALINALVHSDYYERRGVVIEKRKGLIIISNPGALRISREAASKGGVSDPHNFLLFKIFSYVGFCERAGTGLINIKMVWADEKLLSPILSEEFNPDRTILTLPLSGKLS